MPENLGFAHPCFGCKFSGKTEVVGEGRNRRPARRCQHDKAPMTAILWTDPLPTWCPGKVAGK